MKTSGQRGKRTRTHWSSHLGLTLFQSLSLSLSLINILKTSITANNNNNQSSLKSFTLPNKQKLTEKMWKREGNWKKRFYWHYTRKGKRIEQKTRQTVSINGTQECNIHCEMLTILSVILIITNEQIVAPTYNEARWWAQGKEGDHI